MPEEKVQMYNIEGTKPEACFFYNSLLGSYHKAYKLQVNMTDYENSVDTHIHKVITFFTPVFFI